MGLSPGPLLALWLLVAVARVSNLHQLQRPVTRTGRATCAGPAEGQQGRLDRPVQVHKQVL